MLIPPQTPNNTTHTPMKTPQTYLAALHKFAGRRPGLKFANYGDLRAYRAYRRAITRDLSEFRQLARFVELSGITAEGLVSAARSVFSGRLSFVEQNDKVTVFYCAGQYFPTEYRKAACAVLAAALWNYYRADIPPETENRNDKFRRMFGARLQKRWFD